MKPSILLIVFILGLCFSLAAEPGKVLLGIDILKRNHFDLLQGKRIGLVTNHTGCDRDLNADIDILFKAPEVELVKLFSPEHGIRGTLDGLVENGIDKATQLPIISLYGKHPQPTGDDLQGIDVLVFDIQDIGTRFYTYISTMAYVMRAAKAHGKAMIVLDRPNPIGGGKVEGTIPVDSLTGKFTAIYPIATQHGMTIGELARLFNDAYGIGCQLTVVSMQGWHRSMLWDETGIAWINPSPNMKTLTGAILYPGLGCLESTNISMGRGTEIPFEIYGAPWIDGRKLADQMNSWELAGIRFVPWQFTPNRKNFKYYGHLCHGIKAVVYNRKALDGYLTGLYLAKTLWEMYPEHYVFSRRFKVLMGCPFTEKWIKSGIAPETIKKRKIEALNEFKKLREKYLLYN